MSREIQATLISAAMIAIVFLVASFTGKRTPPPAGPIDVYGVELERDARQEDVFAVAEQLNDGVRAAAMQDLGISVQQLAAARDAILAAEFSQAGAMWEQGIRAFANEWRYLDETVDQMPDRVVSDYDEQSQFIAAISLPSDIDDTVIRNFLSAPPAQRRERLAFMEQQVSRPAEDLIAEMEESLVPLAERLALRQMICDRSPAFESETRARPASGLPVISTSCTAFVMRYVDSLLNEALEDEALLRARVLSVIPLAQGH
ncbi:MAG: hypothetical protein AAFY15_00385 [Cyanobacteria bacterium J06648_11]